MHLSVKLVVDGMSPLMTISVVDLVWHGADD